MCDIIYSMFSIISSILGCSQQLFRSLINAGTALFFPAVLAEAILSRQALQICSLHLTSDVTPPPCVLLPPCSLHHCIIYLFYSPSAPKLCHPSHSMCSDSSVIRWQ